ncbi:MAG: bifunctional [glutamate--ammonia ligase]-adenylyl-L-tyrosine phosphorylase/[glutamate--ammonia-ligase] adenylyltransferase [Gammaproteobacteria bacterium]|nr:bifunctional [glutamate--ammonia ligase]-adenylyl-L-tyrosine phosphorylase/[glutamate--ammonia-ligase] adenylyltransferase [Gammaproteobacteria bacterium]
MAEEPLATRLARYREAWRDAPGVAASASAFPPTAEREAVWSASEFAAKTCLREPAWLARLHADGLLHRAYRGGEMAQRLAAALDGVDDEDDLHRRLRHFRQQEMLRITWRDLGGLCQLEETLEDLSELADVCVRQALDVLSGWATARLGVPRGADGAEQHLIVIGMGKLGARELNLSSDIDLVFCYPERGRTDGARGLDNEQFFTRLGRQLITALSRQTADGFVFRVDMRLRPFGDSGPLVSSYDAMEHYYHSQARDWERYAMVKARALTGSATDIEALMQMLHGFVYRRYIDFGVIESIRDMKRMIEKELSRKGMGANIKLGQGGIREIEFIGQAFQLVRGGREREFQVRSIQRVLDRLGRRGILPEYAVRDLQAAYRFLRMTENRIQAWRDEQTHMLPTGDEGRARLAVSMGFAGWAEFEQVLSRHRRHVHEQFGHVFAAPQAEPTSQESPLASVWLADDAEDPQALAALRQAGYVQPEEVLGRLHEYRDSAVVRGLPTRGRNKLDQLMPSLVEASAQADAPDVTIERLLQLIAAIARRTAYLDLLVENPLALSQLVRLAGESSWVVSQLIRQPLLLDELLDPRRLYSPLHGDALRTELDTLLESVAEDDLEQEMERLRQFAQGNRLRVAAADIAGAIPLMVVSDYLTEIAEVTLQRVQASSLRDLAAKYGAPGRLDGMTTGFAIVGYGKLGGIELGYASDLDLVFLHGSADLNAMTDGRRSVANEVYYARLGQRVIHMLTTVMPSGVLYEADMRLRPNGNSGQLVTSLKTFESYQDNDAWTWEHQALVRARAIAGDPAVIARFNAIRHRVLCRERDPAVLLDDVVSMRARMREGLDRSNDEQFHIKHGVGGLVDIEFIVQYAVLRWAHSHPDLTDWTDNARLLERLARHRLLPELAAEQLWNAYQLYRGVVHRHALQEQGSLVPVDRLAEERAMVSDIWQAVMR